MFKKCRVFLLFIITVMISVVCTKTMHVNADSVSDLNGTLPGTDINWQYTDDCKTLTISGGSLKNFKVEDESSWNWYNDSLYHMSVRKVIITGKIKDATTLSMMFKGFSFLEEIDISNIDTCNVTNMSSMFDGCYRLKKIELGDFDTSKVTDMGSMLYNCQKLEDIDLTKFDTHNVKIMRRMFDLCENLDLADVKNWDVSNAEDISLMFYNCDKLEYVKDFNWDTSKVKDMSALFSTCKNLKSIDISAWDMSQVTNIKSMFRSNPELEEVRLPVIDDVKFDSLNCLFYNCSKIEKIDLSMWNIENIYEINYAFRYCGKLKRIYVSKDWNITCDLVYRWYVFDGCGSLTGGFGTLYSDVNDKSDYEMARIDKEGRPGYFTQIISGITIEDLEVPQSGNELDKNIVIKESGCILSDYGIKYYINNDEKNGIAEYNSAYTIKIGVKILDDYIFKNVLDASINGKEALIENQEDGTYIITYTFEKTSDKYLFEAGSFDKTVRYNDESFKNDTIDIKNLGLFEDINSDGERRYGISVPITGGGSAELLDDNNLKIIMAGKFLVTLYVSETFSHRAGEKTVTLTVLKADGEGYVKINDIKVGELPEPKVFSNTNEISRVLYEYGDSEQGAFTSKIPTSAGTYYVRALLPGNDLYNECVTKPVKFEIKEDPYIITAEQEKKNVLDLNAGLKIDQKGSYINVRWGSVPDADIYEVYAAYCGKVFRNKPEVTTKKNSAKIKKINGKKLDLKKNFKLYVVSYKVIDGGKITLGKTITGHVVGRKNKKYTNAKNIKLAKSNVSLKPGGKYKIKAKTILVDKKKKQLTNAHANEFRYSTSDSTVATVDNKGKIYAVNAGQCYVYVYSRNGYSKKIAVTVE